MGVADFVGTLDDKGQRTFSSLFLLLLDLIFAKVRQRRRPI